MKPVYTLTFLHIRTCRYLWLSCDTKNLNILFWLNDLTLSDCLPPLLRRCRCYRISCLSVNLFVVLCDGSNFCNLICQQWDCLNIYMAHMPSSWDILHLPPTIPLAVSSENTDFILISSKRLFVVVLPEKKRYYYYCIWTTKIYTKYNENIKQLYILEILLSFILYN